MCTHLSRCNAHAPHTRASDETGRHTITIPRDDRFSKPCSAATRKHFTVTVPVCARRVHATRRWLRAVMQMCERHRVRELCAQYEDATAHHRTDVLNVIGFWEEDVFFLVVCCWLTGTCGLSSSFAIALRAHKDDYFMDAQRRRAFLSPHSATSGGELKNPSCSISVRASVLRNGS